MSDLTQLSNDVVSCRKCPRLTVFREEVARVKRKAYQDWTYWGRAVPSFGDPNASVLIIGLAPGAHGANRTGRMFTGDSSGDFLYPTLHRHGFCNQPLSRSRDDGLMLIDCYITAVCRCVPPQNRPTAEELRTCRGYLARELIFLKNVQVVIALGRVAWESLFRVRGSLGLDPRYRPAPFTHGQLQEIEAGLTAIASYHPSQQNTRTGRLTQPMFDEIFSKVRTLVKSR